jgi:hypothetical protein
MVGMYLRILVLIEEVTIYSPVAVDVYGYKYEVLLLLVRIQLCVRESDDAGSLEHQAYQIYGNKLVSSLRVDLHGQSWKTIVNKEEIAFRPVGVIRSSGFDEKSVGPRFYTFVRGVKSNNITNALTLTA